MYRRAVSAICFVLLLLPATGVSAQPSSLPTVTAESESWYLAGEPLTYEGHFYLPRGAAVHFDRNTMVRSGFYRGIPLFARTTLEPYSVVFVPLAGGVLQPYERVRVGELAGTVGSLGPGAPVPGARETNAETTPMPQAAGPPTGLASPTDVTGAARAAGTAPRAVADPPPPLGTSGMTTAPGPVGTSGRVVVAPKPRPFISIARPTGANGMFVEFDNARWYSNGPTVEFDAAAFTRIGNYRGLPVYVKKGEDERAIYIPTGTNIRTLLAKYGRR